MEQLFAFVCNWTSMGFKKCSSSLVRWKHDYWLMKEVSNLVMIFIRGTYVRIYSVLQDIATGY